MVDVAVDLVMLTIRRGLLSVLLIVRRDPPYQGMWALPGGFPRYDEDLSVAAGRELKEETGLCTEIGHLEQLGVYGAPGRDPRGRVISVAYLALLPDLPVPAAGSDAARACWQPVDDVGELAFDHGDILAEGVERARVKLEYTTLAAAFCADEFTIAELRAVYEAVWGTDVDPRNFYRKVTRADGFLLPTGRRRTQSTGRPGDLYRRGDIGALYPPLRRPR